MEFKTDGDEIPSNKPTPASRDKSVKKTGVRLRHMVEGGSYHYKGITWSERNGQVHPRGEEPPLSEKDVAYLLSVQFTTPDKKRTLISRFQTEPPNAG